MSISPSPKNLAKDLVRRTLPKLQPRTRRPKNPGESATRTVVAARSGGVCERCGQRPAQSVHHRLKRGQGGPWSPSNCVHLCGDGTQYCHGVVEHYPDSARLGGFHVRPWEHPADVRLRYRHTEWVLLRDDGTVTPIGGAA